jgi:preprotein translocase subunit SecY
MLLAYMFFTSVFNARVLLFYVQAYAKRSEIEHYMYPNQSCMRLITEDSICHLPLFLFLQRSRTQRELGVAKYQEGERDSRRISMMLVTLSVLAVILRSPFAILHATVFQDFINRDMEPWWLAFYYIVFEVAYCMVFLNSCVNFFVYITMSSNFQRHFVRLFVPRCLRKSRGKSNERSKERSSTSTSSPSLKTVSVTCLTGDSVNPGVQ